MATISWPHIEFDELGTAYVQATRYKALHLISEHVAYRWDAEQLQRQHPELSLPQIHAVLGYYYDHRQACDQQLRETQRQCDALRSQHEDGALQARLRQHE